jgi:uroporphyrin-III C-methyltransferase
MSGVVYLVGAGPGAVDLLTLRAARLLEAADVVLHDALVSPEVLALAVNAKLYNVGKRAHRPSVDQRFICRLLVRMGLRHRIVVRLKGGDPHLFGRASEEIDACRVAGIAVATVPGVSAGFAASSSLGVSLTERSRSRSVAFVTASIARSEQLEGGDRRDHWAEAAAAADTAVIYMGVSHAEYVRAVLLARGLPPSRPVALVESASQSRERSFRGCIAELPKLAAQLGDGPAIMIIGEAVREACIVKDAHAA